WIWPLQEPSLRRYTLLHSSYEYIADRLFKAERLTAYLPWNASGSSKHFQMSQLVLHTDSSNNNSRANLLIHWVMSDDHVRYWIYTLILEYTYYASNYT
ncbi:hypothetical protein TGAM01_v200131, partial [Trichoderma gamsii]